MHVRANKVRSIWKSGGTIFSSSVRLPEPGLCEILGYAGFDFVLIDGEHGAMAPTSIDRLVQSCYAGDTVPVVRLLRNNDAEAVMHALDLGAQGILIPHCRTAADARALRNAALYPPEGNRGFGPGRGAMWGRAISPDYFAEANASIVLLALIENLEGVDNVDEIAASGLDCLWVGSGDLAMAYGVPGQRKHPQVMQAAQKVLDACQKHNVVAGFPVGDADEARWAKEQGYRAIGFGGAESYIMQASRAFLDSVGR
jgi:4-hydroxy-2-oxoheptanedioate aldolase